MTRCGLPLLMVLFSLNAMASDAGDSQAQNGSDTATTEEAQVPALIYLHYLNQQAPTVLCTQDPQIACLKMPAELCQSRVSAAAERCGPQLLERWPTVFSANQDTVTRYAREYRTCIVQNWVANDGLQDERLAACGIETDPS